MGKDQKGEIFFDKESRTPWNYIIIIDGGSSGSRLHIYQYAGTADRQILRASVDMDFPLVTKQGNQWAKKIRPGISDYVDKLDKIETEHLKPLFDYAKTIIPKAQVPRTPVYFYATGGLRLVSGAQKHKVLTRVCNYVQKTDFFMPDCASHAQVIDGQTEGLFGWLSLNYMIGSIEYPNLHDHGQNHSTYGFLDMGGASTQIAFVPVEAERNKHKSDLHRVALASLDGKNDVFYDAYSHSYLGLGVNEGRDRYLEGLTGQEDPCMPSGVDLDETKTSSPTKASSHQDDTDDEHDDDTDDEDGDDDEEDEDHDKKEDKRKVTKTTLTGTGNFTQCYSAIKPLLSDISQESKPDFDFDINHFVGVSEYWDTTQTGFNLGGAFDFEQLKAKVDKFCSLEWSEIKGLPEFKGVDPEELKLVCFQSSWLLAVVEEGYKFPHSNSTLDGPGPGNQKDRQFLNPLQTADKINETDFSWTVGPALLYATGELGLNGKKMNGIQKNEASSMWQYGQESNGHTRPELDRDVGDWSDTLDKRSHRFWGSLAFLLILVITAYLILGKTRRKHIWDSVKGRFGKSRDYVHLGGMGGLGLGLGQQSRSGQPEAEDFELADADGFDVSDDEPEHRV